MYNHKLRGRPDEPKNRAIAAAEKSLAMTIQVNSLRPMGQSIQPPALEVARSRQHYNEFRKSYAMKHSNASIRPLRLPEEREVRHTEVYKLNKVYAPPHVNKVPIQTIYSKQKSVESDEDLGALMLLEKLKEMERSEPVIRKQSQELQVSQDSQNAATQSALDQAEKEVMVAQSQIKAIQQLIKVDKTTSKSVTKLESDDLHPKTRRKKIISDVKDKIEEGKHKKMVITLNNLNKRIQQMHEKYFDETRPRYMSLKEVKRRMNLEKNIKVLFKNEGFDAEKEISEMLLPKCSVTIKETPVTTPKKSVSIIRKSASTPLQKHLFTADISSDNYLQNKILHQPSSIIHENDVPETSSTQINSLGISAASQEEERWKTASRCESVNVDVIMSPRPMTVEPNSNSTLHSIQDSILRSEYLMKEFDLTTSDLSAGLSNFESSLSMPRKRNLSKRTYPSMQEFFSTTNISEDHDKNLQKAYMEDTIRAQLKNSLYDIF